MKPVVEHGLLGFRRACRCDTCVEANRAYMREWHARKRGLPPGHPANDTTAPVLKVVVAAPAPSRMYPADTSDGRVVLGVKAEIGYLEVSVLEKYPGLVEAALVLAAGLDNPRLATSHPSLSRQLVQTLMRLHGFSVGGGKRLAAVASMAPGKPPA